MEEYPYDDYTCRVVDFFTGDIAGAMSETEDGWPLFFINDYLSPSARKRAFEHEMRHWLRNDLHSSEDIQTVEGR